MHNSKYFGPRKFTSKANDWELFLWIPANNFIHALRLERKIKGMKSSVYITNLKRYPELVEKISLQTLKSICR